MFASIARALVLALPCAAIAQVAVLQIKVLEGDGAVRPAGARISHPVTVEVTDDSGHPVAGAAVSFQMPADGPGGLFSNGLRTDLAMSDASGHATLHSMQLNRTAGQFQIRITAVKEQARAGIVSLQYISDGSNSQVQAKARAVEPHPSPASSPAPAKTASDITPNAAPTQAPVAHSPGITPTTTKMGSGISKKWLILGALAAGAGVAVAGIARGKGGSQSSTTSSSTVSIGTPTITIGSPNP
jgi:cell division septation protein DedD